MENTLENKAKFFGSHLGQTVVFQPNVGDIHNYQKGVLTLVSFKYCESKGKDFNISNAFIELTSLSSITDEDVIEACKSGHELSFMGNNPSSKWVCEHSKRNFVTIKAKYSEHSFEFDKEGCPLIDMYVDGELTNQFSNEFAYQYLQSKGYALPCMDLTVEQLIEYGWVKLKD